MLHSAVRPYPHVGEVFELTIPPMKGLELVVWVGYKAQDWRFLGQDVEAPIVGRFKLVQIDRLPDMSTLSQALEGHGQRPPGQVIWAFAKRYPKPDGLGPIGVLDPSWISPFDIVNVPFIYTEGGGDFDWEDSDFGADWRWIVQVDPTL